MSFEILAREILSSADAESERLRQLQEGERSLLKKESEMRVLVYKKHIDTQYEKELANAKESYVGKSQREAKRILLETKRALLDECYAQLASQIRELPQKEWEKILELMLKLAKEVIDYETIYASEKDTAYLKKKFKDKNIKIVTKEHQEGLLFENKEGNELVDLDLELFLKEFFSKNEDRIQESLFFGGGKKK